MTNYVYFMRLPAVHYRARKQINDTVNKWTGLQQPMRHYINAGHNVAIV